MTNIGYKETIEHRKNISNGLIGNQNAKGHKNPGPIGQHWTLSKESKRRLYGNDYALGNEFNLSPETIEGIRKRMIGNQYASGCKRSKDFKTSVSERMIRKVLEHLGPYKDTKPELRMKEIFISLKRPFKHQVVVKGIRHVFDFIDIKTNTLIEVDGKYYHTLPGRRQKDYKINRMAKKLGYKVLRFWDDDVMKNPEKVIERLKEILV